jgi:two-component system, OmpR family, KDP operon response regulator KdpE
MSARSEPSGATVLVIEDDDEQRAVLVRALRARGYRPTEAVDGRSGLERWAARRPDIVLLDLGLPDVEGIRIVRHIRSEAATPIVILSARYDERQKVEALDAGADDYLTKPFGVDELNARLRVALRHSAGRTPSDDARLVADPLVLDIERHEVTVDGRLLELTPREFEILRVLMANPGRLVTKAKLLRAVWGEAYQAEDNYVYVHVSQLRRKLAAADSRGRLNNLIITEPGVGYRIRVPDEGMANERTAGEAAT